MIRKVRGYMKRLNKKGFTLVELLAVIVVLAVVMLIAVNAVIPQMNRSRKQAFITEATTVLGGAETYFMYHEMTSGAATCVDVQDALIGEYVEEKGKADYDGVVMVDANGKYTIHLTNGSGYYLVTTDSDIATLDDTAVKTAAPTGFKTACS